MPYQLGKDVLFAQINKLKTYRDLETKEENILYFVGETGEIYKGDKLFSSGNIIGSYDDTTKFPMVGDPIKLYIDISNECIYRWDQTKNAYIKVNDIEGTIRKLADNSSIEIKDDKLQIKGFDKVDKSGLHMRSKIDDSGNITVEWYDPSTEENPIANAVSDLQDAVKDLGDSQSQISNEIKEINEKLNNTSIDGISGVKLADGVLCEIDEKDNKAVIPKAKKDGLGVVKSTDIDNGVSVLDDGSMTINSVDVMKLYIADGDTFVISGGNSDIK